MKKLFAIVVCIALALGCMFACTGNKTPEPTAVPTSEPTAAPTTAPTNEPTAAPTEDPNKVKAIDVKGIVTDVSEIVAFEEFYKAEGATCDYYDSDAFAVINGESDGACISLRGYDQRYIDEGTGLVDDDPVGSRTLADTTLYPFFAIKLKLAEGATMNGYGYKTTTWNTSLGEADNLGNDAKELIADGQWHTYIFNIQEEFPQAWANGQTGDPFDCFAIGTPNDGADLCLAWYGCFESENEINAWDANYTERFPADMA